MTVTDPRPAADVTHPGGMRAKRAFPTETQSHLDPFVLFEEFHIAADQGFDTHPHRGFEIVSYVLEGGMVHDDSLGHSAVARAGDAMQVTTGRGVRHSELPADDAACSGLQLWVNLPRELKGIEPAYRDAAATELPVEETPGATVTTVVGDGSSLAPRTEMAYLDATVTDSWTWSIPDGWRGFCYAVSGTGTADGDAVSAGEYLVADGEASVALSTDATLRAVAVAGVPHDEPIRQRGPFVE